MALQISKSLVKESALSQVDFETIEFGHQYSDHMFLADYSNGEWRDLRIEPYHPLSILPGTAVLHYAQTIFEGMKAYRQAKDKIVLFRPDQNIERLNRSALRMQMPELSEEIFFGGLIELLKVDQGWVSDLPGMSLYVRPFMFATDQYIGIRPSATYTFIIFTCPVGSYYNQALSVKIEEEYSRAAPGGTGYAKAGGNYAGALAPMVAAQAAGFDQLIWTDAATHEFVEESGTMNLMFVKDGTIITPALRPTILAGITRDSVLQVAEDLDIKTEARQISVAEITEGLQTGSITEAFGVGTAAVVAPIERIAHGETSYQLRLASTKPESGSIAGQIYGRLAQIRAGEVQDSRGWLRAVE